jgi:hypothetical protein
MKLAQTLKLQELQSTAAGTQATVPDSRSADEWIKKYLDDKNKRLNDLRRSMNFLLGPEKGEMQSEGTSEGASKGWDTRGRGRKSLQLVTGDGWYAHGKFYPVNSGEQHIDVAVRDGLAPKMRGAPSYEKVFTQPDIVRIRTSKIYGGDRPETIMNLEGSTKEDLKNVLAVLPRDIKTVNLEWWHPKYDSSGIISKEEAIDVYAAWRMDKPPIDEQDVRKVAGSGKWLVVSPEDEIISRWETQDEAEKAAYANWKGITPSSTGATAGARVKRLQAEDVFSDPALMEQGRRDFIKHPKPRAVQLADWLREGDHRPSSAGGAAGNGGTAGGGGGNG